jgi:hypothetical protein
VTVMAPAKALVNAIAIPAANNRTGSRTERRK